MNSIPKASLEEIRTLFNLDNDVKLGFQTIYRNRKWHHYLLVKQGDNHQSILLKEI